MAYIFTSFQYYHPCMISGFHCHTVDAFALLGCYVAYVDLYDSILLFHRAIQAKYVHTLQNAVRCGYTTECCVCFAD